MDDSDRELYEKEVSDGLKARRAYESFIKGYVEDKMVSLFESFCEGSTVDINVLQECKRLVLVLKDMEQQVLTIIQTGELASKTLAEEENNGR